MNTKVLRRKLPHTIEALITKINHRNRHTTLPDSVGVKSLTFYHTGPEDLLQYPKSSGISQEISEKSACRKFWVNFLKHVPSDAAVAWKDRPSLVQLSDDGFIIKSSFDVIERTEKLDKQEKTDGS